MKLMIIIGLVTMVFLTACSSETVYVGKQIEGEVQKVSSDFIIVNSIKYDLCNNKEDEIQRFDYVYLDILRESNPSCNAILQSYNVSRGCCNKC